MNNVKEFRTRKGLSQFGLAKLSNISQTDISRIENGGIKVYPGWRLRLAKALDIPAAELFPKEASNGR